MIRYCLWDQFVKNKQRFHVGFLRNLEDWVLASRRERRIAKKAFFETSQ